MRKKSIEVFIAAENYPLTFRDIGNLIETVLRVNPDTVTYKMRNLTNIVNGSPDDAVKAAAGIAIRNNASAFVFISGCQDAGLEGFSTTKYHFDHLIQCVDVSAEARALMERKEFMRDVKTGKERGRGRL